MVCSPPYLLGRLGIIMLGSRALFVPGIILLVIAVPLQTGAVTATKAVKFSAKLATGQGVADVVGSDGVAPAGAVGPAEAIRIDGVGPTTDATVAPSAVTPADRT